MFHKIDINSKRKNNEEENRISVDRVRNYNITKRDLNVKTQKAELEIKWHSNKSKQSNSLENEFTNYVEDFITDSDIENGIKVLNENLDDLKDGTIDFVDIKYDKKGKRLIEIIELFFPLTRNREDYWFVKVDITTEFKKITNSRGPFRVILINTKDIKTSKHYLEIVFLDPYHLFIPGKHNGKTAEQYKRETYEQYIELDTCLSKHIK